MREITLLGMARQNSVRLPHKMLRSFGETTLFDIYMSILESVKCSNNPFKSIVIALSKTDKEMWDKAQSYQIPIVERNSFSATKAEEPSELYHFLSEIDTEYIMWLNGCFPFITLETINKVARYFQVSNNIESLHCVHEMENWYWNEDGVPLTFKGKGHTITQDSMTILESVHCFNIHNRNKILYENKYWELQPNDPVLYRVNNSMEFLDIDNMFDFQLCEKLWRSI